VGRSRPPIQCIPEKEVIQEAVDSNTNKLKYTLLCKVELHVPVWSKGTPEQFLVHRQKGNLAAYEKAEKDKEEWTKKLAKATAALEK
jgi:hypothetical protein